MPFSHFHPHSLSTLPYTPSPSHASDDRKEARHACDGFGRGGGRKASHGSRRVLPVLVTRVPLDPSLGCMFGESGSDHGNDARGGCSLRARPSFVIPVPSHSHPRSVHYIHL